MDRNERRWAFGGYNLQDLKAVLADGPNVMEGKEREKWQVFFNVATV